MRNSIEMPLILIGALVVLSGCTTMATYERQTQQAIDVYYGEPDREYTTEAPVSADFRELGLYTGKGSDDLMIEMLKDEAAKLGADAVINVEIDTDPVYGEVNSRWFARGMAVQYADAE